MALNSETPQLLYHSIDPEGKLLANALPRLFAITYDDSYFERLRIGEEYHFLKDIFAVKVNLKNSILNVHYKLPRFIVQR